MPNGKKRFELGVSIPLIEDIINHTNNSDLEKEFNEYLKSINYDAEQVSNVIKAGFQEEINKMFNRK